MPKNNELVLKSISELLSESFFIPAYQRGYRWTRRQVTELLDDISDFQKESDEKPKSVFYCLQPVVVKQRANEWELVDGQQRLTTIFIILHCLKDILEILQKTPYQIRYETRPGSATYLETIDPDRHQENIDFFHMYEAKKAILEWFDEKGRPYALTFLQALLNGDEIGKNVKVIWYQINEEIDATSVFTRLNLGKIPLTNAELVKALFLKGSNFEDGDRYLGQLKVAQEWDDIERALQQDDFWFFLSNRTSESNRIDFILELVASQLSEEGISIPRRDPYFVFLTFSRWLAESGAFPQKNWARIKGCYMTLREWFDDRTLFHLVGFLVSRSVSAHELFNFYARCPTKRDFRQGLTEMAFKKSMIHLPETFDDEDKASVRDAIEESLGQLTYDSPNPQLISVLLLFNVATLLGNPETNARFQFDCYKQESWDIEHIKSVASEMPESKDRQKLWLESVIDYIEGEVVIDSPVVGVPRDDFLDILSVAKDLLAAKNFDSDNFEKLYSRILDIYAPNGRDEVDHSIGNLTLLDSSTNRSYQNAIFPIKRNRIISLDKKATFVPLCTKNVFLKYYSEHVDNMMFWTTQDSENHLAAMAEMLTTLFFMGRV